MLKAQMQTARTTRQ